MDVISTQSKKRGCSLQHTSGTCSSSDYYCYYCYYYDVGISPPNMSSLLTFASFASFAYSLWSKNTRLLSEFESLIPYALPALDFSFPRRAAHHHTSGRAGHLRRQLTSDVSFRRNCCCCCWLTFLCPASSYAFNPTKEGEKSQQNLGHFFNNAVAPLHVERIKNSSWILVCSADIHLRTSKNHMSARTVLSLFPS